MGSKSGLSGSSGLACFGSFARDTKIRKESDIDFLLDFKKGEKNFDNLVDLGEYLENLLGRRVELLTRESLKSETGKHIIATSEEINFSSPQGLSNSHRHRKSGVFPNGSRDS